MRTAHLKLYSEVSFPKELFKDGFITSSWQAGIAPQSSLLVDLLLTSSWGQQRGVRASASCQTFWWLVSNHKSHTVVGTSFQASACKCLGSRFDLLESCWKGTVKTNIHWWLTAKAFYVTVVKKSNLQQNLMWRSVSDAFCRATQGHWILGNQGRGRHCMFQKVCDSSFGLMHHHLEKDKAGIINRRAEPQ